jgi:hypothetical protein
VETKLIVQHAGSSMKRGASKATSPTIKTVCVYLAQDEVVIRKHAKISGFPTRSISGTAECVLVTDHSVPKADKEYGFNDCRNTHREGPPWTNSTSYLTLGP